MFDFPSERLIAVGRLVLTLFAVVGYGAGLSPGHAYAHAVLTATLVYFAFAIGVGAWVLRRLPSHREQVVIHAVDIGAVSVLMALTEGPTSPFFVFFTFILLASTVRWNWRGALATAGLLIAAYAGLALILDNTPGEAADLTRSIIRGAFLMVAGGMLGYVGAYRERSRGRLAQLIAWPGPDQTSRAGPPVTAALAHAARLLRAPRILVVWEQPEEPFRHLALFTEGRVRHSREPASRFGGLVASDRSRSAFSADLSSAPKLGHDGVAAPAIDPDLSAAFAMRKVLTAPFQQSLCRGRAFVLEPAGSTDDDLLLVELIATRLGVDLEHHLLRQQIESNAALGERVRLGRDLHDGLLQSLAAANIQLKLCTNRAQPEVVGQIEETRALLSDEQQRIRRFVEDHRPAPARAGEPVLLAEQVSKRMNDLGRQWRCEVEFAVTPPDLEVPPGLATHVRHLLGEAVSNAARHGPATRIGIMVARGPDALAITIEDDGQGFAGLSGSYQDGDLQALNAGPASLRSRVAELGGTIALDTSPEGSRIEIRIAL